MNSRQLLEALQLGQRVYGTLVISTSPRWPEALRVTDIDFVFFDGEHMPLNREQLAWMCQTYRAMEIAPLVRIPSPDPYEATKAMDGGAVGIIAPYVETEQQVVALGAAVKTRPLRGHKANAIATGAEVADPALAAYLQDYNNEHILVVNIESKPALDNLDRILSVPQLDAVLIGPHDLSCSLGIPEDYTNPLFKESVEYIIRKSKEHQVASGIHWFWDNHDEINWAKQGMQMLVHGSDLTLFTAKISEEIRYMKQQLNDSFNVNEQTIRI